MDPQDGINENIDFRQLFECSPALMLVLNPDLHIIAMTEAYLEATMTQRREVIGQYLFDVFPDNPEQTDADGVSNLQASLDRVLKYKQADSMAVQRYDIRRPEAKGGGFEERYWSPLNSPVFETDGTTVRYIIHRVKDATEFVKLKDKHKDAKDLIERTELEVEILARSGELQHAREILEQKNNELMRSNAEIESFSYSVSHDLRAPLRAISGYASILSEEYNDLFDDEGRRLLGEVRRNSKKMGELIDDLLALSKLGRKEIRISEIDMHQLVGEALTEITRDEVREADIRIHPLHNVIADRTLILHVFINLLSNAIKYSSLSPQPVIEVSSQVSNCDVIYTVSDNGVGFDMTYASKLFGVFQRLHAPADFEGTGVGLAIVKRIVERHGGRVWATAKINEGAAFSFSLPQITTN